MPLLFLMDFLKCFCFVLGEALNIDPQAFYTHLYSTILDIEKGKRSNFPNKYMYTDISAKTVAYTPGNLNVYFFSWGCNRS